MKQIISLGFLFDMSIASLSKTLSDLSQAGGQPAVMERSKAIKKSLEGVERAVEKLSNLKNKVKKLDPNQESLNNIRTRVS